MHGYLSLSTIYIMTYYLDIQISIYIYYLYDDILTLFTANHLMSLPSTSNMTGPVSSGGIYDSPV